MPFPKLLIQIGVMAASMAMTAMRKIGGPRLDDLKVTNGDYGNPLAMVWGKRRMQVPIFWAEDLKEVKQERKTKGGKYNDYTYFGTWAVALAGHEISGVTRVWFDTHLVYDATGAGPITPFDWGMMLEATEKGERHPEVINGMRAKASGHAALYLGTEDQEPDPRMQATVEAEFGEGSCPAYRGTAYLIWKDFPLEKFGNRIPQVSVEVVSSAATHYPFENFETETPQPSGMSGATFSNDYSRFMWSDGANYEIWDVAARSKMISGQWPEETTVTSRYGLKSDGTIMAVSASREDLLIFGPDGTSVSIIPDMFPGTLFDHHYQAEIVVLEDDSGGEHWFTIPSSTVPYFYIDGTDYTMEDRTGVDWNPYSYFIGEDGVIWAAGREVGVGATTAYFHRVYGSGDGPGFIAVGGLPAQTSPLRDCYAVYYDGKFILAWDTGVGANLYAIDPETGVVLDTAAYSLSVNNTPKQFANLPPGSASIWLDAKEISLADLSLIRTIDPTDWTSATTNGMIYDPINHALWTAPLADQEINILYLDRIQGDGVTLGSIAADVADMVGVEDYDFTALDQTIPGWSATRGQASNMLEPLFDAYDSDIRPHDFQLQGTKRLGVSGGTLETASFARKGDETRYTVRIRQSVELPVATIINFADVNADQQPNSARSDRPLDATDARGEKAIDLTTLALDADAARQLSDRHFRRIWNERREVALALTSQELKLEPADVRTLDLDGQSGVYRCVKTTIRADDVIATEWKYEHPSLANLGPAGGAEFDGRNPSVIVVPLISKGFVLDIPLLSDVDSDANPVVYLAAAPYASGAWPGAVVYQATDGEYSDEIGSVASSAPATWGYANGILPDANPWLWDRGSSVNVTLQTGTLTGTTEAAIDANPRTNMALIGDEIINFTTATLEGDGTYTLSGFKRGRRGAEWACGTHAARDVFLLLNTADSEELGLSEVGTDLTFKAITSGRTEGGTFPIGLSPFTGASLKPYAPCHLEAVKESNGDWTLSWVRRTRVGGAWTSGTSIPLSEASEEYELDLSDGVDTVTKTVTSAMTYIWTQAAQITDVGGEVMAGSLDWTVVQISDAVDRGFAAEATA